ncbi:efflux RND transporter periplasmic adaptor subunit [Gemmata sp. JC673]|uniref:Efflux RND transporter periplasmic adaptor subunit n=1 Tax=Gemmata algarum TaxID=2975278 RepID=A0ABU5F5K2_9BACT|nr:efflux RND transporter periplasmic adaptor subunit [Gemmata algarum]MDY3562837.1 efflux RND transporter periplasmic adaptor subunit [Gemmata algarum]
MKIKPLHAVLVAAFALSLPACDRTHAEEKGEHHHDEHKIVATTPQAKDVILTQQYVCQIRSQSHIEVCALQDGYLEEILVKEGQAVKQGDVMFKILPTLYKARLAAERAEAQLAQIEFLNTKKLYESTPPVVSVQEVNLAQAKLDKANARVKLAEAEVDFTVVKAPFNGIVDRQLKQLGSLIEKKDILTTLSDNGVMRAYFNVPEARYLADMTGQGLNSQQIELVLADGSKFPQHCQAVLIEGKFNSETGNIAYRADFPNTKNLLRHGQTGTVLINRVLPHATVIPQRATFETLDKRYVFVVGEDHKVHQRLITIAHEMDDIFVIKSGLSATDKFVLDGVRQVRDGQEVHYEFRKPEEVLANQKHHAE